MMHDRPSSLTRSYRWPLLVVTILCVVSIAGPVNAAVMTQRYEFAAPTIGDADGLHAVTLEGGWTHGEPGQPMLPMAPARILLPPGAVIDKIEIIAGEEVVLPGSYLVAPGQRQYPLSFPGPFVTEPPDPAIYESATVFPGRLHDEPQVGRFRGYQVASFALHPVQYVPASGSLSYLRDLTVRVTTVSDAATLAATARMIRHDTTTLTRIAGLVDNAGDAAAYRGIVKASPDSRNLDPAAAYDYLIITTATWAAQVEPLVTFHTQRGYRTGVVLKSWILDNYTDAVDEQESIRNFIIDAYTTWETDYVLLLGDAMDPQGIPHRGLYSTTTGGETDEDIAADMYYGCLDGSWNDDGDGRWGEPDEADLYHEIGVGRGCVDSPAAMNNFLTKTIRYQNEPVVADCNQALMVGELLWDDPTWGGDYKDEIRDGSTACGYTTVGFPPPINVSTLYDRDYTWSKHELIALMEGGLNIVNHLGHCNVTYAMKMNVGDIGLFDNDGVNHNYNFVYGQGCYCGSFDNRGTGGGYGSDCFGEEFQTDDDGAVAAVMNSRYGWGAHSSTNGSSQYYDRQFFDALFGEEIYPLADINDDSKMDNVWAIDYSANRWCYYELNVFGDPAMHLWTATPGDLEVGLPPVIFLGDPEVEVTVTAVGNGPLAGARVTAYSADYSLYETGVTDASGQVSLAMQAVTPDQLYVTVVAHDYLPFSGECPIVAASAWVMIDDCVVLDASGDNDGIVDASETVGLEIALENVGVETATGLSATVSSDDPHVTMITATQSYPDLVVGGSVVGYEPFVVAVAGDTPDEYLLEFTLTANADQGLWEWNFSLPVEAPLLVNSGAAVDDSGPAGNHNGRPDPGETVIVSLEVTNAGHSATIELSAVLTSTHPEVVIHDGQGEGPAVPIGAEGALGPFEIEILPTCPFTAVPLQLVVTAVNGFTATLDYHLQVGPWFDNTEEDMGWTLGAPDDDATVGFWIRDDPIGGEYGGQPVQPEDDHTPEPGVVCFVTGNTLPGQVPLQGDVDDGKTTLLSPYFNLTDAAVVTLSYWRWYTNDLWAAPNQDWWDVDVTADGEAWVHLEHTTDSANSWNQFTFDVGSQIAFSDSVQFRFVASDYGMGSLVEAAVDDIIVDVVYQPAAGLPELDVEALRRTNGIVSCSPNPFNPHTAIVYRVGRRTPVSLKVYDVGGRMVRALVDGVVEAGEQTIVFDSRNTAGRPLASGIYFLRMETPEIMQVRQLTLLK